MAGTGKIWSTLSAFGQIADWHPYILRSRIALALLKAM